jgi:hypothetical protein
MWIVGVLVIVVIAACVAAIFLGGGEQGPFVAISKFGGRRYGDHCQDTASSRGRCPAPRSCRARWALGWGGRGGAWA